MDISRFLSTIDQEDYDQWLDGRKDISGLVDQHKMIALMFKSRIEEAIDENSPEELIEKFKEYRPDLELRDRSMAKERIEEECENIKSKLC